ncbi:MAG: hypothetical protein ACKVX9_10405, partial [Blastocatellia bacterium]
PENAEIAAVRVAIGKRTFAPGRLAYLPGNGLHEVELQLPEDVATGPTEARVMLGELASPPYGFEIR